MKNILIATIALFSIACNAEEKECNHLVKNRIRVPQTATFKNVVYEARQVKGVVRAINLHGDYVDANYICNVNDDGAVEIVWLGRGAPPARFGQ